MGAAKATHEFKIAIVRKAKMHLIKWLSVVQCIVRFEQKQVRREEERRELVSSRHYSPSSPLPHGRGQGGILAYGACKEQEPLTSVEAKGEA